jgi:sugar lactone lactonase YvrE
LPAYLVAIRTLKWERPVRSTMIALAKFEFSFLALTLVLLAGCGGGGHNSALPAGQTAAQATAGGESAQQMNALLPNSQSPASFTVAAMQATEIQPESAMAGLQQEITPQSVGSVAWTRIPGGATSLAVAPDDSLWALGAIAAGADRLVWHYANGHWTNIPGSASSIAVGPDETLYAVKASSGGVYAYNGAIWRSLGGSANSVTTSLDGSVYVLSKVKAVDGNSAIWKYKGGVWTQQPGAGAQLAGSFDPGLYGVSAVGRVGPDGYFVVKAAGAVYYYSPGFGYVLFPGTASSVAPATGGVFALGYPASPNGEEISYFGYGSTGWITGLGLATSLAAAPRNSGTGTQLYITVKAGTIWTTAPGTPVVTTLAGGTLGFVDGIGTAVQFKNPSASAVDSSNNLYIADTGNNAIRKCTPAGEVITIAIHFSYPTGIAVDAKGNIYVSDAGTYSIKKVTPDGTVITTLAGSGIKGYKDGPGAIARFSSLGQLAIDASGDVYVADTGNQVIRKITPAGDVTTLAGRDYGFVDDTGTAAEFRYPTGVAVDSSGNVYVADSRNHAIRKISPAGAVTTLAGNGTAGYHDGTGPSAQFDYPGSVTVDSSGIVYVSDDYNYSIRAITPARVVTTLAGNRTNGYRNGAASTAEFSRPTTVAVDKNGNLYVTDENNNAIRRIR